MVDDDHNDEDDEDEHYEYEHEHEADLADEHEHEADLADPAEEATVVAEEQEEPEGQTDHEGTPEGDQGATEPEGQAEHEGAPEGDDQGAPEGDVEDTPEEAEREEETDEGEAPEGQGDQGENQTNEGRKYNLRQRTGQAKSFKDAIDEPHNSKSYYPASQLTQLSSIRVNPKKVKKAAFTFAHVLTQMSARAALRKHGQAAKDALMEEFAQLEDLSVYEPVYAHTLTRAQRKAALRAINLVKEKRTGKLKGRTVADGRSQRNLYDKSETASPTVSTDALMLTIVIDGHEKRDVATADVAGAYLKAKMKDFVLMKFVGDTVELLCELDEKYRKFVVVENGQKVLYVRLMKALYGCVKSALLWYQLFSEHLEKMGFEINPYDACTANKTINGKQCTIAWYVDDAKISHVDADVVTDVIQQIEERFQKMTVTRGKQHTFLGMDITYTSVGTAEVSMRQYLEEAIVESGLAVKRKANSPARKDLFEVDQSAKRLTGDRADRFHSVAAKLLFVSIRARMDILLPIAFLCTRVSKSTTQDEAKLLRLLEYVKATLHLKYTLGADNLAKLRAWVDASYAVHPDQKSHTGGIMSFGTGGFICKSSKQKLNTKSSTEAELVGASDYLPNILWVKMFLEAQGYRLGETYFEQDNESAIKLERNGRMSAGPRSRHINIRYFWIKDRVKQEHISVRHCPTENMLGDFFTKPLQGSLFVRFRDVILGYKHIDTLSSTTHPIIPLEERVGNYDRNDGTTVKESNGTAVTTMTSEKGGVTWADIVRNGTQVKGKTQSVVSSSFSRNNPGS